MTQQKEGPTGGRDADNALENSCRDAQQQTLHPTPVDDASAAPSHPTLSHPLTANKASSDHVIDTVVHRLNAVCRRATFEVALAVGNVVIEYLYGGDLNLWRSRDPRKTISLRKLARHPHLPMSPSALYRSIAIYELCERLHIKRWHHVSTSHLRLVLPLQSEEQIRLLEVTEANTWTVRRLDQEIRALVERNASRGGPKRRSRLSRAAARVGKSLDTLEMCMDPSLRDPDPSPDSVMDAIACLRRAREVCAMLERRLSDRSPR